MGCWNLPKLGNLVLVNQVTRKHVRFCKKSHDRDGIMKGIPGSYEGDGRRGKTPIEGSSQGKVFLASGIGGGQAGCGEEKSQL